MNNPSKQEHLFQRPLCLTRARLSMQCPPLSTPYFTPFLLHALLWSRCSREISCILRRILRTGCSEKLYFLLYYFCTQNLRIFYMADCTLCLGNAAATPVFPYSPVTPFLSEPVCRLLWAVGAARHSALQNETPPSATSRAPSEKPTKQFRSGQIREGNQGKRK